MARGRVARQPIAELASVLVGLRAAIKIEPESADRTKLEMAYKMIDGVHQKNLRETAGKSEGPGEPGAMPQGMPEG